MARVKIGNIKPVKGVDYFTSDDYAELDKRFAPADCGLGGSGRGFNIGDIDEFKNSGWYYSSDAYGYNVDGVPLFYILMRVDSWWNTAGFNTVVQTVYYDGLEARRFCQLDGWRPWEWVNPPMMAGVEYRTTERYMGKPVYTKLVDCGGCPGVGTKIVAYNTEGAVDTVVSAQGTLSGYMTFPSTVISGSMKLDLETSRTDIVIHSTQEWMKDAPCFVLLKYTKN